MSLLGDELFTLWAPSGSRWSVWAKPIVFAEMEVPPTTSDPLEVPQATNFPLPPDTATILLSGLKATPR